MLKWAFPRDESVDLAGAIMGLGPELMKLLNDSSVKAGRDRTIAAIAAQAPKHIPSYAER